MSTKIKQNQPVNPSIDLASKYKQSLQKSVDNSNAEVLNYIFKPRDKVFVDTFSDQTYESLKWFTILSILNRFFYTDENTCITYISNIVADKDEKIVFSFKKRSCDVFGKLEHDFAELDKLSFGQKGLNRKIILVWIYKWKLMKIEAPVTSERWILAYLQEANNENTADMSSTEKKYKEGMSTSIIALEKSQNQIYLDQDSETKYFKTLDDNIKTLNNGLISWNIPSDSAQYIESGLLISETIASQSMQQNLETFNGQIPVFPEQTSLSDLTPNFDFSADYPDSL